MSSIDSHSNLSANPTHYSESEVSSHPSKEGENDIIPLNTLEHLALRDGPMPEYINSDGEGHNGGNVSDNGSGVHSNAATVYSDVYDSDDHAILLDSSHLPNLLPLERDWQNHNNRAKG